MESYLQTRYRQIRQVDARIRKVQDGLDNGEVEVSYIDIHGGGSVKWLHIDAHFLFGLYAIRCILKDEINSL